MTAEQLFKAKFLRWARARGDIALVIESNTGRGIPDVWYGRKNGGAQWIEFKSGEIALRKEQFGLHCMMQGAGHPVLTLIEKKKDEKYCAVSAWFTPDTPIHDLTFMKTATELFETYFK